MKSLRWLLPALLLAALASAPAADAQKAQPRIIGGSDAPITSYPFQVSLRRNGSFICGGSIRDATHIITAAHCVTLQTSPHLARPANQFSVGYGSESLTAQTIVGVASLSVPSQYTASLGADESYDAAVLTLSSPIDLSGPSAKAIPLADPAQSKSTGTATVTGWGDTAEGSNAGSATLQSTSVPLLADQPCVDEYGSSQYVASRAVCAGGGNLASGNPDTCQGDSGGPLAVDLDASAGTDFVLMGITSFGNGCGRQDTPAVYTYTRGMGVASFLGSSETPVTTTPPAASAPPPATSPPATPAFRDLTRPTAKVSKLSCTKKRRCSFRVSAADRGGSVKKLTATVTRKVTKCRTRGRSRVCSTTTRKKTLRPKRISGGFSFTATLTKATYKLTAVATDTSGNRSKTLTKTFRVR